MIAQGGKAVYGAALGILMLEARFPRIPGDMGNALSFPFPVHYRVVRGASPARVVLEGAPGLLQPFIEAGRELAAMGVDGVTTNCGFLSIFQAELQAALPVPVAASSLMQARMIEAVLPRGWRVGILTISAATLTKAHLAAAHIAPETPIYGMDELPGAAPRAFAPAILGDALTLDVGAARADLVEAAQAFCRRHDDLGAILLECTNMTPYAADIREMTGLPVYSMQSFVEWFHSGLVPRRFASP